MIQTSDSIKAISAALLQFQGSVNGVKRDGKNPHFKSNYATLENVIDTARPALQECGISFVQAPGAIVDGALEVTTRLTHAESGEWMQSTMHMPLGKRDPQGAGSATTYGLRYSLMAMLGLPPTDDDGEAAIDRNNLRPAVDAAPVERRSSASLDRDGAWQRLMLKLSADLGDCKSVVTLSKLRADYREMARKEGWPRAWLEALANEFDTFEQSLEQADDNDVFPGDLPSGSFVEEFVNGR